MLEDNFHPTKLNQGRLGWVRSVAKLNGVDGARLALLLIATKSLGILLALFCEERRIGVDLPVAHLISGECLAMTLHLNSEESQRRMVLKTNRL